MKKTNKTFNIQEKSIDEDNYTVSFLCAKNELDRDNEVIAVEGIDTTSYQNNPVVLTDHNHSVNNAVAKCVEINKELGEMVCTFQFIGSDSYSSKIFNLIKEGVLSAVSIGFIPNAWEKVEDMDGNTYRKCTESELLEISIVTVPALSSALVRAYQKGIIEEGDDILGKSGITGEEIKELEFVEVQKKELLRLRCNNEVLKHYRKAIKDLRDSYELEKKENEIENLEDVKLFLSSFTDIKKLNNQTIISLNANQRDDQKPEIKKATPLIAAQLYLSLQE